MAFEVESEDSAERVALRKKEERRSIYEKGYICIVGSYVCGPGIWQRGRNLHAGSGPE
jgi:hypothetical protein